MRGTPERDPRRAVTKEGGDDVKIWRNSIRTCINAVVSACVISTVATNTTQAQFCGNPQTGPRRVVVNSTSRYPPLNFDLNPGVPGPMFWVTWTPYSEIEGDSWGCGAAFVLDGGAWISGIVNGALGNSGCSHTDWFEGFPETSAGRWSNQSCKHTLQVRTYFPVNGVCLAQADAPFVDSSEEIILWIDALNTSEHETQETCTGGALGCPPEIGRPVNLANGRMHHDMVDVHIDGPLPIEFSRRYDSGSIDDGPMGYGWQHSFMARLVGMANPFQKTFIDENMRRISFNCASGDPGNGFDIPAHCNGLWLEDNVSNMSLAEEPVGSVPRWRVTDKYQKEWGFDASGRLLTISDRNGNVVTMGYGGSPSRLTSVTDAFGRGLTLGYDPSGTHVTQVIAGARTFTYTYDSGNLNQVFYPGHAEPVVAYAYNAGGHRLTTATDGNGHVIEDHVYGTDGRVTDTQSADGNYAYHIEYLSPSTVTVRNARDVPVTTTFTLDAQRGVATDRVGGPGCSSCGDAGDETHKEYDDWSRVIKITDGSNAVTKMSYDRKGNVLTQTEAFGTAKARTTTFTYHPTFNRVTSASEASVGDGACAQNHPNRVTTMLYDPANGDLLSVQTTGCDLDFFTHTTAYTYDAHGQVETVNGPRDDVNDVLDLTTVEYYPDNDADLNRRGRLKKVINALGHETTFDQYDLFGNPGLVTDPNDVQRTFLYDGSDRVTEVRVKGATAPDDIVTEYRYDIAGNLDFVRLPNCVAAGASCAFSADYGYDSVNRLTEIADPLGNKIVYGYDKEGNRIWEEYRDASATVQKFTNFAYDNQNRLQYAYYTPTAPEGSGSIFEKISYYPDGTIQSVRDPMGHSTSYTYDALKRLETVAQTVGGQTLTTTYAYDTQDNLLSVTDPGSLQTIYRNGDSGGRLMTISPDTGTSTYAYDEAGNLLSSTNANAVTTTRAYDVLDRLVSVGYSDSTLNLSYSYDSPAVAYGIGRRTGMTDPSGASVFGYDRRGFLTTERKTIGTRTFTTGYEFDKNGNRTRILYPTDEPAVRQGEAVFGYDAADRVASVAAKINGSLVNVATNFAYKPFGPRTGMTFGNGLVDTRTYGTATTKRYQLNAWTLGSLLNFTHTYDDDLNLTTRTDNLNAANNRSFGYDESHRLNLAAGPWGPGTGCPGGKTYTYDPNGNRVCKGEGLPVTNYSYWSASNKLQATTGGEVASYAHDANGNTTNDGTHSYQYNQADRLATVDSGVTATYKYDGLGRRAQKTASGATTYFFFDPTGRMLSEVQTAAGSGKDYLFLGNEPIGRVDWQASEGDIGNTLFGDKITPNVRLDWTTYSGTTSTYLVRRRQLVEGERTFNGSTVVATVTDPTRIYDDPVLGDSTGYEYRVSRQSVSEALYFGHADHLATPIALTDGTGAVVWRAEHLPFGGIWSLSVSAAQNNVRFPGQYFDGETDFAQNWFRDYSARIGRYLEPDPLGLAAGPNLFGYVSQNPMGFADPKGLAPGGPVEGDIWLYTTGRIGLAELERRQAARDALFIRTGEFWKVGSDTAEAWSSGARGEELFEPVAVDAIRGINAYGVVRSLASLATRGFSRLASWATAESCGARSDWATLSGMLRDAARGNGNFGIGAATRSQAQAMGEAWVGPGFRTASDGATLISADGLRQFRPPSFKPTLGRFQANFEARPAGLTQWQSNAHLDIVDP